MHKPLKLGVLISGRGSNLQALIDACALPEFPARIVTVASNKPGVQGLERAAAAQIPSITINHRDYPDREAFEVELDRHLLAAGVELVCLAGFMRVLTPWFVARWRDRMVNIHPSLLPSFPGVDTHARALAAGVRFTGCTVHYVCPDVDAGPVILQAAVPVLPGDDADRLAARVLLAEHRAYPYAVRLIAEGRVRIVGDRVEITGHTTQAGVILNPDDGLAQAVRSA
ncbi:MAG: phosphoribosylglycinamide formyltransferase [Alphaproteobacteria bacterium]